MNKITSITKTLIKRSSCPLLALLGSSSLQGAVVTFDAINDGPLDGSVVGTTAFDTTTGSTVSITTADIIGYDGTDFVSAIGGPAHTINTQSSNSAFGVNSASTPPGAGNDSRDFDPGEQWVFSFSTDVELVEFDLGGQGTGEVFQISSTAFTSPIVLEDGQANDRHNLGNIFVSAGTTITVETTSGTIRLSEFTVNTVPEPSSAALLGLGGLALILRRRK